MNKNTINRYLGKWGVELHGKGYLQALSRGAFKKNAFDVQKETMQGKTVATIFDLGANRGDTADRYHTLFPSAVIHCFEPFEEAFTILQNRFPDNRNLHMHQLAIASSNETKAFYVNKSIDTNSLLKPRKAGLSSDKQVENRSVINVNAITLDWFCEQNNISYIDILKMDIQGGELDALKGAERMLRSGKIGMIYSEVFFIEQYEMQPVFHDISKLLYDHGYQLKDIYDPFYGNECIVWADVIFVKK